MLLSLPAELLQLILIRCSTTAYLQSISTCRRLYEIGTTSRRVVLHHLRQTPGLDSYQGLKLECFATEFLFRILLQRAGKELYGAQFRATIRRVYPEGIKEWKWIDGPASSIDPVGEHIALVVKGQPWVCLFRVESGNLILRERIKPPWDREAGEVDILKTVVVDKGNKVYVLYRLRAFIDEGEGGVRRGLFRLEASALKTNEEVYLAVHELAGNNTTVSEDKPVQVWGFHGRAGYEPRALAVRDLHTFAISWRDMCSHEDEVELYTALKDIHREGVEPSFKIRTLMQTRACGDDDEDDDSATGYIPYDQGVGDLAFVRDSQQLLYYPKGETMFRLVQDIGIAPISELENKCTVRFAESVSLSFALGVPFFGLHTHVSREGPLIGRRTYLTLGLATHRSQGWTVACLLKSEEACPAGCEYVLNLNDGLQFGEWTVAARLWGFQRSTSTLGSIVAASKLGTRIAVADWKTLYIWALEPEVLVDDYANLFYPACMQSTRSGMIELRPIVLQLQAVCFKLRFMEGENELLAVTDRGVIWLDLSPMGRWERTSHLPEYTQ